MVKEDEMKWLTWLTIVSCLYCIPLTASWADMEEVLSLLTVETESKLGHSVSNAGDVNGDGYDDLIVGTYSPDVYPSYVYIFFSGPTFDTIPDVILSSPNSMFGEVLSSAGDVNGDGYSDVMVYSLYYLGIAYIYYGGNPMDTVLDVTLVGQVERDFFGQSMAEAGDLNSDGYDDVIIGAYMAPNGGKAYVYFGGDPMDTIPDLILKNPSGSAFGLDVRGLGDVNGDGYSDVGVGDPYIGSYRGDVYIYCGGPNIDRYPEFVLKGLISYSYFGYRLAGCDLNSDGYSDVIVGEVGGDGRVHIYGGGTTLPQFPDLTMSGRTGSEALGIRLRAVGDLDDDGYEDFVAGNDQYRGRVYAYYGRKWMDRDIDLVLPNAASGPDNYGIRFAGLDFNGDGHQDLAVGSRDESLVYVYRIRHKQFVITLKPDARTVALGEKLGWSVTIANNTGTDQSLYFWVDLLDPDARYYGDGPVLGPKLKKIPAGNVV